MRCDRSFPALSITDDGVRRIYFDNPAGTQVPAGVASAMSDCLLQANANLGGYFASSAAAGRVVDSARLAMADFLNAPSVDEIIFGQNMTTLTLHLSRSIGRQLSPGDEIILSQMDHDANVWPWVLMARDCDLVVKWLPFSTESFEFDLDVLDELLTDKTRLLCVGGASNLIGTINDIETISAKARAVGAMTYIDAVQSAPHVATDVQQLGCDFLVCSAYKFFGPHQGVLWGRRSLLENLEPYKVRPAPEAIPDCFETGTQSHEDFAGVAAAVDYFAWIGETMAQDYWPRWSHLAGRRQTLHAAMDFLFDYEKTLAEHLLDGLAGTRWRQGAWNNRSRCLATTGPDSRFYAQHRKRQNTSQKRSRGRIFLSGAATTTRSRLPRPWESTRPAVPCELVRCITTATMKSTSCCLHWLKF